MLLIAAGVFFLLFGILGLMPHLGGLLPSTGESRWWNKLVGNHARGLFQAPYGWRGYLLGVMLGFIPCGLVYGALVMAAATGAALNGGAVMLVFGLGTVPMLFVTGFVGQYAAQRFRALMVPVGRGLMIINGIILFALAATTIA